MGGGRGTRTIPRTRTIYDYTYTDAGLKTICTRPPQLLRDARLERERESARARERERETASERVSERVTDKRGERWRERMTEVRRRLRFIGI